jgi:large subunit ribosomal protein L29
MNVEKIINNQDLVFKDIKSEIIFLRKELFNLRIKKATQQNFKPHLFKKYRHSLNQLNSNGYRKLENKTDQN